MDERNSNYQLETARNGLIVPTINGIYLHSIYNPLKEAEAFAENFSENLKKKNTILILGLGFGYHVDEIAKAMSENHKQYQICVLETNKKLIEDFTSMRNFSDENISIVHYAAPVELYQNIDFVKFLMTKPSVIKHEASFTLNTEIYTEFLKYKSPEKVNSYRRLLTAHEESQLALDDNLSLAESAQKIITQRSITSREEYLTMALTEIVKYEARGKDL